MATDDWQRRRLVAEATFLPWVSQHLELTGRTILEYGCGPGPVSTVFAGHAGRYIGIDIDERAIVKARRHLAERGLDAELIHEPAERAIAAVGQYAGELDVLLCYAVLEHLSFRERQELLTVARAALKPDGAIVVIETPNRLALWDHHTAQLPFYNQIPDDVALEYADRSGRTRFTDAIKAARAAGDEELREVFVRWGRGMSFHEFELAFDDLPAHVLATSWEPELLPERAVHVEELALQRMVDAARPDLPPCFSRYWLDLILTNQPIATPRTFMRPWQMNTWGSDQVWSTAQQTVYLTGPGARLAVALPSPAQHLAFLGLPTSEAVTLTVASATQRQTCVVRNDGVAGEVRFDAPAALFDVRADAPVELTFVGYAA